MKNKILLLLLVGVIITGMIVGPDYSNAYVIPPEEINPADFDPIDYQQFSENNMRPMQAISVSSVWGQ